MLRYLRCSAERVLPSVSKRSDGRLWFYELSIFNCGPHPYPAGVHAERTPDFGIHCWQRRHQPRSHPASVGTPPEGEAGRIEGSAGRRLDTRAKAGGNQAKSMCEMRWAKKPHFVCTGTIPLRTARLVSTFVRRWGSSMRTRKKQSRALSKPAPSGIC
jgi:hypothetical protein